VIRTSHSSSLGFYLTLVKNFFFFRSSRNIFIFLPLRQQPKYFYISSVAAAGKKKGKNSLGENIIDSVNKQPTTSRLLHLNKVGGTTISSSSPARYAKKREWFPAGSSSPPGDRLQIARRTSPRRLLGTVSFTLFASCCAKFYGVQPTLRRFVAATWCAVRVLWAKIVARIFPPQNCRAFSCPAQQPSKKNNHHNISSDVVPTACCHIL
jgi:hypothetical protein